MINTKNVLVVDDDLNVVEVVKTYLEKEGFNICTAYDGKTAIELFYDKTPSLLILDSMLPDTNGKDICKEIRKISKVPIIMVTSKVDETSILTAFKIGVDDYMTKPFSPRQLVARVNALLRRIEDANISSNMYSFFNGDLTIDFSKHEVRKNGDFVNLTLSEFDILKILIKHPHKAFSREELLSNIYGSNYKGKERVIDTHIKNLRQKIESSSKEPQYILTVFGVGYRFGGNLNIITS